MWVFINKRLAVDLGGAHQAMEASIMLSQRPELGLQRGRIYEAVIFQAERHVTQSSYRLTLSNFVTRRTECVNTCGDGIVQSQFGEECDDGNTHNTDACSNICQMISG